MRKCGYLVSLVLGLTLGCGSAGSQGQAQSAASTASDEKAEPAVPVKGAAPRIPRRCAKGSKHRGECLPPPGWVKRLCDDVYPDVALHMFSPGTPWKRLYMLARADPFNASGGASLLGDKLERGEEVIALKRRQQNEGGIQVGEDNAGYDVLRWNGACATIHDGDYAEDRPSRIVQSKIEWRRLSLPLRQALEAQPDISAAYEARRKSCKGRNFGRVEGDCETNDRLLMQEIVRYIQSGPELPAATRMP
ncbi:MAG TPA: hypothetical protein VEX18_14800 [Polyangiaceae bacterium]|nr:hypothetical protein [Polyangiaceae bacterium]